MTTEMHDPRDDAESPRADQIAGRMLDDGEATESVDADLRALDAAGRRRLADLQWIHSLVGMLLRADLPAREARIARACAAIQAEARQVTQPAIEVPARRGRFRWLAPTLVAAAVVIAAVWLQGPTHPRTTALAAVESSLKAAQVDQDRAYTVQSRIRMPSGNEHDFAAELWVRGATHYVFQQEGAFGGIVLGGDGAEHWIVPALGPVLVSDDRGAFDQTLIGRPLATPYLQVTSLLERMAHRYELTLLPEESLSTVDGGRPVRCLHVVGRSKADASEALPSVIELWAARQSGIAYRLRAQWDRPPGELGLMESTLELKSLPAVVAPDWYRHTPHHHPDRRILRRSGDAGNADL